MSVTIRKSPPKRGRPPKGPQEGKKSFLSTRIPVDLRSRLEHASAESGRSLSQEIEFRLEQSFIEEEARYECFGGKGGYEILRALGAASAAIAAQRGNREWWSDKIAFGLAERVTTELLQQLRPKRNGKPFQVRSITLLVDKESDEGVRTERIPVKLS